MILFIYLDHNIIDDISKGLISFKPTEKLVWVYSNTNLEEINRSGDTRFLQVLEDLKARKIELDMDKGKLTGSVKILEYQSPYIVYDSYLEVSNEVQLDLSMFNELIARLMGNDNHDTILSAPKSFEDSIKGILEPYGLFTDNVRDRVEKVRAKLSNLVSGPLQDVGKLETTRKAFNLHNGRTGNLAKEDNPIQEIWSIIKARFEGVTADQFFGFEPVYLNNDDDFPLYLGIISCHSMLNTLGFRPDDGLTNPEDMPGILSDGSHIGYASYCHGFISRDKKLLAKAKAIYKYKNISTVLLTVDNNSDIKSV